MQLNSLDSKSQWTLSDHARGISTQSGTFPPQQAAPKFSFAFAPTDRMLPLRALLKPGTPFKWNNELDQIFQESKSFIVSEIQEGVRIFGKTKPTCLATDWSRDGIGYWLLQKPCHCPSTQPFCCPTSWRITLVGSRFTHAAESRYAPVEGKALAVANALDKTRFFVLGCNTLIIAVEQAEQHFKTANS